MRPTLLSVLALTGILLAPAAASAQKLKKAEIRDVKVGLKAGYNPDEVPEFQIPAPEQQQLKSGTCYFYPLPPFLGLDERLVPNAAVSPRLAVLALSKEHSERLLTSTPLKIDSVPLANGKRNLTAATHVDIAGFLDVAGKWDPSLAFVMGGALAVSFVAFRFAARRPRDFLGAPLALPERGAVDRRLILGSLIFGIGWGLAGVCPGPGIVDVGYLEPAAIVFVAAMIVGMLIHKMADIRAATPRPIEQDA